MHAARGLSHRIARFLPTGGLGLSFATAMIDRRGDVRPGRAVLALATLLALALAGCSTTAPTILPTAPGPSGAGSSVPPGATDVTSATEEPQPSEEPTPTLGPVSTAGTAACDPSDLKVSHGIVEGAAGSRLTEVVLVSASACSIDAYPALGLRDANGQALVGGAATGPGRIDLVPGTPYTSDVRLDNWCLAEPAFPLSLEVEVGGAEITVTGSSFPEQGDMPPCNGPSGPTLEANAWVPTP